MECTLIFMTDSYVYDFLIPDFMFKKSANKKLLEVEFLSLLNVTFL